MYFVQKYNREYGRRVKGVSPAVLAAFTDYAWPGNIRQLSSVMERAVLLNEGGVIGEEDIRGELRLAHGQAGPASIEIPDEGSTSRRSRRSCCARRWTRPAGWPTKAARLLGMSYKTFLYRLEKFHLD